MSSTGRALREEGSWMLSTGWYMSLYHPVSPPLNEAHFRDWKLFLLSSIVPICSSPCWLHMQEQVLQVFSSTQGEALKGCLMGKGLGCYLVLRAWVLIKGIQRGVHPLWPSTSPASNLCPAVSQIKEALFWTPSKTSLPDTQHSPMACRYYRPNDNQVRVTSAQGGWASAVFASGLIFLSTREHSNTTYRPGTGCWW